MDTWRQDLRYAARMLDLRLGARRLARTPGFTLAAWARAASHRPARRASRVDPVTAFRSE